MSTPLPTEARIVIVGAGAIGCSVAMHLAEMGARDVVVVERAAITHGSTWHAAGLVGQYRSRLDLARLMQASVAVLDRLQKRMPIDWRAVGSLRVASSLARWRELREGAVLARRHGIDMRLVSPTEARDLFPPLNIDGVEGAAFVAGDGHIDPTSLAMAYAAEARARGARIVEGVTVTGVETQGSRAVAVQTDQGRMTCESLVLAPGVWARAAGRMIGLDLPVASIAHQYAVTEKSPLITRDLPAFRDPDLNFYLKPDAGAFAIGGWEADSRPAHEGETPADFNRALLADDLERLSPILRNAMRRLPLVGELGIRRVINGPIPVTPDGEPIVGPAPGWRNVFLGIGFTSGIAASAGVGKALAEWILAGAPEFPLPSLDAARFGTDPFSLDALNRRACAAYSAYYALAEARAETDATAKDGIFAMPASSAFQPSFAQAPRKPRQEP